MNHAARRCGVHHIADMAAGNTIPLHFDPSLVVLSYAVSVLGSIVALECAVRVICPSARIRRLNIAAAAFALGGVGVWATHFIGMSAMKMPYVVDYDLGLTLVSLATAIVFSASAIWFVGRAPAKWRNVALGGSLAGLGMAATSYVGMAALQLQPQSRWNPSILIVSAIVAIVAASAALWLAFRFRTHLRRVLAAFIMGVAVCGAHYVGIAGGILVYRDNDRAQGMAIAGESLQFYVFFVGLVILGIAYVMSILGSPDERVRKTAPGP